ncbi:unnamed protein product [Hymenolepis diminuta]|uniref:HSF_DOMAIN domain-containing protein n=1 Tax=Hymenolepis diminuta TaxID=6216 RepID=A0A0R3SL57_HYMDI|nr:unnamed protein product [Hymenolepis diminuta]
MCVVSFLQLYARLNDVDKAESAGEEVNGERAPPLIRKTGLRGTRHGGGTGRQRRGGTTRGTVSGRGRRPVVVVSLATPTDPPTSSNGTKETARLGPLHVEVSPSSPGAKKRLGRDAGEVSKGNIQLFNGEEGSSAILPSLKGNTANVSSSSSSAPPKRNLFSIEALTAVEPKEQVEVESSESSVEQPPPPKIHQNGGAGGVLTSTQWLERLKRCVGPRGFLVPIDETEMNQLTHLLITDSHFKQEVARLPHVFQMLSNFYAHQQQLQFLQQQRFHQQRMAAPQSFAYSQQNSSVANSKTFPQPTPPSRFATHLQSSSTSSTATGAASHPYQSNFTSAVAASSSAAAAAVAAAAAAAMATVAVSSVAGIRPPPPPPPFYSGSSVSTFSSHYFPGQPSHPVPMSSYPPQMLPPPPPSSSRAAPSQHQQQQQCNHQHPFMTNAPAPPPSPSLWGTALSHPGSEFPYQYYCQHQLMQNPNLQVLHKAPPPADAVDLTSSGNSSKRLPPPPTPVNKTPMLPPPSPPARHLPPSQSASTSPKKPLPRFANLFHFDGLYSNRGATGHLRICYYIMKCKWPPERPFAHPCWYLEPGSHTAILKPIPQKPPPQPLSIIRSTPLSPRFPNYGHFIRAAIENVGGVGVRSSLHPPPPPIAIDLTRSPPPITSRKLPPPPPLLESDLLLKRRRTEAGGGHFQGAPIAHFQNGGVRMPPPASFLLPPPPFPHFRQPP